MAYGDFVVYMLFYQTLNLNRDAFIFYAVINGALPKMLYRISGTANDHTKTMSGLFSL